MDSEQKDGKVPSTSGTTKMAADVGVDTKADADVSASAPFSLSLHDCLSLGEIEVGLERRQNTSTNQKGNADNDLSTKQQEENLRSEEVQRLPYLLRLLSNTRPLASIQSFAAFKVNSEEVVDKQPTGSIDTNTIGNDEYLDRIVDRLEDVAANYSVAEGIDVVTNHLGPSVAKNLSRLSTLVKTRVDDDYSWNTEALAAVARDPIAKRKRPKREANLTSNSKKIKHEKNGMDIDTPDTDIGKEDVLGTTSDEDEDEETGPMDIEFDDMTQDRRASFNRRDSIIVAAEDSQESTVIKTLSELVSLVVKSLDNRSNHEVEGEDDQPQHSGAASGSRKASSLLTLDTDDILSEKAASISTGHDGDEGNDLSSTIVAIMHSAPVLQSRHVANALCRASVPQTGDLVSRLGANCPASVPSLLLGCIEAYCMSIEYHHRNDNDGISGSNSCNSKTNLSCPVVTAAKSAIAALARLSHKESCRVQTKLRYLGIMIDMQLKLALQEESKASLGTRTETRIIPISSLLIEHLSFPADTNIRTEDGDATTSNTKTCIAESLEAPTKSEAEQTPGDTNIDSTQNELTLKFATACSKGAEPSFLLHFVLNEDLYVQTLNFFSHIMKTGASISPSLSGGIKKSIGKWKLILRAFALLLLVPLSISTTTSNSAISMACKACTKSFLALIKNLDCTNGNCESGSNLDRPKKSNMDNLVGLVSSCAVLLLSRNLASGDRQGGKVGTGKIAQTVQIMKTIFKILHSTSEQSDMFRISVEDRIRKNDTWGVFKCVLYSLEMASNIEESYANHCYNSKKIGLNGFCQAIRPALEELKNDIELDISFVIPFRLEVLRRELDSPSELLVEETKKILHDILKEENEEKSLSLMRQVESAQFVVEAARFLIKSGSSEIPLVLPAHIDLTWSRIASKWKIPGSKTTNGCGFNFLLRLMYAFIFLDKSPMSPFAFDPRSSPIKESLIMIQNISSKCTRNYLLSEIEILLRNHYPELNRFLSEDHIGAPFGTMDRKSVLAALCRSIRTVMRENNAHFCENTTERLFLQAKSRICNSDLYSAVANAFLSSDHAPSSTYSYHLICRDPIVCLKFPLSVWRCRSLRRIALSVLENLLTSNNVITFKESRFEDTALELLAARDAIVVRCLLSVLHGGDSENVTICSMTTSFIRWMIRRHSGLVALMVKQGLNERDLDWLIENVPETINDSRYLLKIFSERNGLTAAERLVAADAAIRVAIVHGQGNDSEAGQLILTAVSQLVDSFYLIVGPIGLLPVDALFSAESGTPITQISQKAAFRLLKALTKLRGVKNHVRRDCSMVLQKLISLCKQELQGGVTGRRKQLIKEMYDAAVKVEK